MDRAHDPAVRWTLLVLRHHIPNSPHHKPLLTVIGNCAVTLFFVLIGLFAGISYTLSLIHLPFLVFVTAATGFDQGVVGRPDGLPGASPRHPPQVVG